MSEHPYGAWILTPVLVAFAMAVLTRRIVISLIVGVFAGSLLMANGNPFTALYQTWETHLWPTLIDPGKMRLYSFTIAMGAMVGVITASGAMRSLIDGLIPFARTRRRGQLVTWLMGIAIFFDDYASTILLGSTLRPLYDRLRISRAKLAYIIDSTAAPTASLAFVSTWIAVEIEYISDGLVASGLDASTAFEVFIYSIPYRFYVLTSLFLVPISVMMQRDLGSMHRAELECLAASSPQAEVYEDEGGDHHRHRWLLAVIPIATMLLVVISALFVTGQQAIAEQVASGAPGELSGLAWVRKVLGAASSSVALQYGALAGLGVALGLPMAFCTLPWSQLTEGAARGVRVILPAVAVLWTASALSRMTSDRAVHGETSSSPYQFQDHRLYAADYLAGLFSSDSLEGGSASQNFSTALMPTVSFLLAAVVAFCTGTSYGTMGILLPMVIPLVCKMSQLDGDLSWSDPVLLASIAGVLSGAVFGDHCSPISDTTILSSQSSGCDHLTHVWTQAPYAALAAIISVALGTLPIGLGVSVWYLLPIQLLALVVCMRLWGRNLKDATD